MPDSRFCCGRRVPRPGERLWPAPRGQEPGDQTGGCVYQTGQSNGIIENLEATAGIEPAYTDLQSAASPLRHVAIL